MISVIVPIYNVEQYLSRCVDSIINQTYKDIEIILVNDGSPDRCGQMCDEYAQEDARVRVVHKVNGGLSDARNAGLEIAKGEYVTFVDSDDYIAPNMLEHLLSKLEQYDADIAQCLFRKVNSDLAENITHTTDDSHEDIILTGIEAMESCLKEYCHVNVHACAKLYKMSLFSEYGISFPVGRIHEDNFTTYKLCYFAQRVVCSSICLYYYLIREGSIMEQSFSLKRLDAIEAAKGAMDFVKKHSIPLENQVNAHYILACVTGINRILMSSSWKQHRDMLKQLRLDIKKNIPYAIINRYALRKTRFHLFLLWFGYRLYIPIMRSWWILSGTAEG